MFRVFFDEEIKGIDDRHVGHHLHFQIQLVAGFGKHHPRQVIAERVLLPIDEMIFRTDAQRIGLDGRAGVDGGSQADDMRRQPHRSIVTVGGDVIERDPDSHTRYPRANRNAYACAIPAVRVRGAGWYI